MSPVNTLLIEGTFAELADELAQYVDAVRKATSQEGPAVYGEISPSLDKLREQEQSEEALSEAQNQTVLKERDAVLKKLVVAASGLNAAPEKEIVPAFNLLIHLVNQSSAPEMFLPRICTYLSKPIPSSPQHGPALALSILSTVFNTLPASDSTRYHVLLAIVAVIRTSSATPAFEALKSQLTNQLPRWIEEWELDEEETQKLHVAIADASRSSGDNEFSYSHLISALQTIPASDSATPESRELAVRSLSFALLLPNVFDFTPLAASDAVQNLRSTDAQLFELLEVFAADTLDAYEDLVKTNPPSTISSFRNFESTGETIDVDERLRTKMRLLTLTTLAASTPSRSLPYDAITSGLRIPREDVEKWVIDTIRAGLVEGKLSQLKGEFLVHRATYRVFGEKQWSEVQGRLMVWRRSLENVLGVIQSEKDKFIKDGMAAASAAANASEGNTSGGGRGGDRRRGGGGGHQNQQQQRAGEPDLVAGGD